MALFNARVHAVVLDEQDRILLGHRRDKDLWDLPGGSLEPGELPTEGVIRETREETGLEVEVERLFEVGVTPDSRLSFVFYCRPVGGEITPTDESDAVSFFARNELPVNISPRKQDMITAAYCHPAQIMFTHITSKSGSDWLKEQMEKKPNGSI